MTRFLIMCSLIALSVGVSAQITSPERGLCGHTLDADSELRLRENVALANSGVIEQRSIERYIPITFHYIGDDNGNGYPRPEQALDQLASINELYADQEFIFYIDQIKYTANSRIYNTPANSTAEFQMKLVRDNNAMDIFITKTAESGSSTPGITLGYYSPQNDWIVMRQDEFNGNTGTLGHEIGHFFSLAHPHNGWDCEPYDEETHGNPVSSVWSPCNSSLRVELEARTNCNNSGDFICDTPPDYNFGFGWSVGGDQCAPYDAGTMDPNGDVVNPLEVNVMAYFLNCEEYQFTNTQKNVIRADFLSSRRSYLRTGVIPETDPITEEVVYNFPINDEETPAYNLVDFDWDDVPGANQYLVIIDRLATFSLQPARYVVTESEMQLDNLNPNIKYYWRAWPYNESQTGAGWSATQSFFTGTSTSVNEIQGVDQFDVFPNPTTDGTINLSISGIKNFDADIVVFNMSGQVATEARDIQVNSGSWNHELDVSTLSSGLYIVQVRSAEGTLASKFSVQ